jgi:hypothetical protein
MAEQCKMEALAQNPTFDYGSGPANQEVLSRMMFEEADRARRAERNAAKQLWNEEKMRSRAGWDPKALRSTSKVPTK